MRKRGVDDDEKKEVKGWCRGGQEVKQWKRVLVEVSDDKMIRREWSTEQDKTARKRKMKTQNQSHHGPQWERYMREGGVHT